MVSLSNHEAGLSKLAARGDRFRLTASHLSCFAKKGNPKKATPIFALILRCSQRAGPAQIARTPRSRAAIGLMVQVYDRALLRSSGSNTRGPVGRIFDRFAIAVTGTRMRASGLRPLLPIPDDFVPQVRPRGIFARIKFDRVGFRFDRHRVQ